MSSIAAHEVSYRVGTATLVDRVSLRLQPGELCVLGGRNGAGKSTLLALLAGLLRPSSGTVTLDQKPLHAWSASALAKRRALLPQHDAITQPLLAREVVALGRSPFGADVPYGPEVEAALAAMGVSALADRTVTSLSGGERQRVQLARVLAQVSGDDTRGRVLLLDEPTSALDLGHQHAVLETVRNAAREQNIAVAVVLHDLNLAACWADRLVLLREGCLLADGTPGEVLIPETIAIALGVRTHVLYHPDHGRPQLLVAGQAAEPKGLPGVDDVI